MHPDLLPPPHLGLAQPFQRLRWQPNLHAEDHDFMSRMRRRAWLGGRPPWASADFNDRRVATDRTPSEKSSSWRRHRLFTVGHLFEIEHRLIVCVRGPPRYPNAAGLAAESPRPFDGGFLLSSANLLERRGDGRHRNDQGDPEVCDQGVQKAGGSPDLLTCTAEARPTRAPGPSCRPSRLPRGTAAGGPCASPCSCRGTQSCLPSTQARRRRRARRH